MNRRNFENENINPCAEEADLSRNCLDVNLYDYSKCYNYFENYNRCKKFWGNIRRLRRINGIEPVLPTKEERDKILKLKEEGKNVFSAN